MNWKIKELYKKGEWQTPFNCIATGQIGEHEVMVSIGDNRLLAYVGNLGIYELPISEVMDGLRSAVDRDKRSNLKCPLKHSQ